MRSGTLHQRIHNGTPTDEVGRRHAPCKHQLDSLGYFYRAETAEGLRLNSSVNPTWLYCFCFTHDSFVSRIDALLSANRNLDRFLKGESTSIELSGRGLTAIEECWTEHVSCEKLDLSNNQISTVPHHVQSLNNLRHLDLSCNQIAFLPPILEALGKLEELILHDNQIETLPENIGVLSRFPLASSATKPLPFVPVPYVLPTCSLRPSYLFPTSFLLVPYFLPTCSRWHCRSTLYYCIFFSNRS